MTELPPPEELTGVEEHRLKRLVRSLRSENRDLKEQLLRTEEVSEFVRQVDANAPPVVLTPTTASRGRARAIANMVWSDWHIEEEVVSAKVNGLNSYNVDIAERRLQKLLQGMAFHLGMHSEKYHIDQLVIHLGGDLMTGWIHEELAQSAYFSPTETFNWLLVQLRSMLHTAALEFRKLVPKGKILVVCTPGNHGRFTAKNQTGNKAETSFEWLLFQMLAHEHKDHEVIDLWAPQAIWMYVDQYEYRYRYGHGDEMTKGFGAGSGVGGITIPLNKAVARLDKGRAADCTVIGHWHQLLWAEGLIVNGSAIGTTPYSLRFGHREPEQGYWLTAEGRGRACQTPIWLKEKTEPHSNRRSPPSEAQWEKTGIVSAPAYRELWK